MLLNFKNTAIAATAAFSIAAGAAAPAHAFGSNERKFLQGIAAALIVGAIINENKRGRTAAPVQPQPQYYQPADRDTRNRSGRDNRRDNRYDDRHSDRTSDRYDTGSDDRRQPRVQEPVQQGRVIGADNSGYNSGLAQTATARAFNSYSYQDRRMIQSRLAAWGYYGGGIDGAFGPRTHQALYAFASKANRQSALDSTSGAYSVLDALLS